MNEEVKKYHIEKTKEEKEQIMKRINEDYKRFLEYIDYNVNNIVSIHDEVLKTITIKTCDIVTHLFLQHCNSDSFEKAYKITEVYSTLDLDYKLFNSSVKGLYKQYSKEHFGEEIYMYDSLDYSFLNDYSKFLAGINKEELIPSYRFYYDQIIDFTESPFAVLERMILALRSVLNLFINKDEISHKKNEQINCVYSINQFLDKLNNIRANHNKIIFSGKLSRLCKQKNINNAQLANKMNVSRPVVGNWLTATNFPTTDKLLDLSILLETSIDYLINPNTITEDLSIEGTSKRFNLSEDSLFILERLSPERKELAALNYLISTMKDYDLLSTINDYLAPPESLDEILISRNDLNALQEDIEQFSDLDLHSVMSDFYDERLEFYIFENTEYTLLMRVINELVKLRRKNYEDDLEYIIKSNEEKIKSLESENKKLKSELYSQKNTNNSIPK